MALNCQKTTENIQKTTKIHSIPIQLIAPNPNQPRKSFTEDSILKLADSISQYGIIQPLTVRKVGDTYELVAGERRLRAAKELNMTSVPCIIADINESKSAEIAIIENLIRENLTIFEQAEAIETLIDTYNLTQEQIAAKLSNSQSFVANKLRLLRLNATERELILQNNLTERHARALLRVIEPDLRAELLSRIIAEGLNVSASEKLIDAHMANIDKDAKPKSVYAKSINSLYTTINRAIEGVKSNGISVKTRKVESDSYIELSILIPKESSITATESLICAANDDINTAVQVISPA